MVLDSEADTGGPEQATGQATIGKPQPADVKLVRAATLCKEFVLVDGVGRSGKGMMGHVLASMDRVEKVRLDLAYDTVHRLYLLGKLPHDAAVSMLSIEADMGLYNNYISREVNFRFSDMTGIWANTKPATYIRRLFAEEGQPVVDRINRERPIFQSLSHDALECGNLYFDAFGERLKFVHVIRDPVDIIYEWLRRGFGERIGTDGREFQFSYQWRDQVVPIYAVGWEDEYLSISPTDRVIRMVNIAFNEIFRGYSEMSEDRQARVKFVIFEEFVVSPHPYCRELADFLGTTITPRTKRRLKKEQCPRVIPDNQRGERLQGIRDHASAEYMAILSEHQDQYRDHVAKYGLGA